MRTTLVTVIGIAILIHTAFAANRVAVALFALKLNATPFTVGVLMSLYALLPMIFSVAAGRLTDRIGARGPMLWSTCVLLVGIAVPFFWPLLPALFASTVLIGAALVLVHVTAQSVVGAAGGPEGRAARFSWLALGFSGASFLGPMIAGFAIDTTGYVNTFLVLAFFPLASLAVLAWKRSALPHRTHAAANDGIKRRVADLLIDRRLRGAFIAAGLLAMGWDTFTFVIPIYCTGIGLSASTIGIIMGSFAAATFAVRLVLPLLVRHVHEWQMIAAALLISGSAYLLLPLVTSVALLVTISFMLGIGLGCAQPMVMSLLYALSPPGRQGEAVGVRATLSNASGTALPLVFGALGSVLGMVPVFLAMAALLLTGGYAAVKKVMRGARGARGAPPS